MISSIRRVFVNALGKYPILVNSLTYGFLCCSAEISQQTLIKRIMETPPKPYDPGAIARFTVYGSALGGPILTLWYRILDRNLVGTGTRIVIKKVLLDQFIFTPQLLVIFFVAMSAMERKEDLFEECRQKFMKTFQTSCLFWLPAQGINFFLVPPTFRVIYVGICSFAWLNAMSWIKNQNYEKTTI